MADRVHYNVNRLAGFPEAATETAYHTMEGARDLSAEEVRMLLRLYMQLPVAIGYFPDPNYTAQGVAFNNGDMMVVFAPYVREGRGQIQFVLFVRTF